MYWLMIGLYGVITVDNVLNLHLSRITIIGRSR